MIELNGMRDDALAVVSAYERGHTITIDLATECAYHVLALLDHIGHPGCTPEDIAAFVACEPEYSVFADEPHERKTPCRP